MSRSTSLFAAVAVAALTLAPSLAEARAGGGASFGSRGGRTYSAPPSTNTSPYAAPMDRTMTPRTAPSYGGGGYAQSAPSRGGFGSALMGGLLGAGIGGLLFGHGLFGGGGGFGFIGFLLQAVIIFFIARWLFRTFFRRTAMAGAGMGGSFARMGQPASGMMGGGSAMPQSSPVSIGPADYQAFERTLQDVQAAWSAQSMPQLQAVASPEMVSYFSEQLAELSRRGVRNTVTDVRLDKGDLSEAWAEGGREYATVAMRFSMIDVTRDSAGNVVDGNPAQRSSATELWTFVRANGRWMLSAIQQGR
ncbi:MAG: Tim44 domain-containing protein [Janthinobacterium lividum]